MTVQQTSARAHYISRHIHSTEVALAVDADGRPVTVPADWPGESLLRALREPLALVGVRCGCGTGLSGARTVLFDSEPVPSWVMPISVAAGRRFETVEDLAEGSRLYPVRQAC